MSLKIKQMYLTASSVGDVAKIEYMVIKECKTIRNKYFMLECLHMACKNSQIEVINVFVSNGVINKEALHYASVGGKIEVINIIMKACVERRKYKKITQEMWCNCIYGMCEGGNFLLFRHYINKIKTQNIGFWNMCLVNGCKSNNVELVSYIVDQGASQFNDGLRCACARGQFEMTKFMMKLVPVRSELIFKMACEGGNIKIVEFIMQQDVVNFNHGLEFACKKEGHVQIIELMIKNGATRFDEGLEMACCEGNLDIVKLMIEKGARNFNAGLEFACKAGHVDVAEMMLKCGATKINKCMVFDFLKSKRFPEDVDILKLLIRHGGTNFLRLKHTQDFKLYTLYRRVKEANGPRPEIAARHLELFKQSPWYTFISGVTTTRINRNSCLRRFPRELARGLFTYL